MYKDYTFMFVPIIIGALGTMLKRLEYSLYEFGFSKRETKNLIQSVHIRSISGTIKIRKTFLRFAVWRCEKSIMNATYAPP